MSKLIQWWRVVTGKRTIDEQRMLEEILHNRGIIVGTQQSVLTIVESLLPQGDIEKVVENLKRLPTVMNKAAATLEVDSNVTLPESYEKGIAEAREAFLIRLADLKSSST